MDHINYSIQQKPYAPHYTLAISSWKNAPLFVLAVILFDTDPDVNAFTLPPLHTNFDVRHLLQKVVQKLERMWKVIIEHLAFKEDVSLRDAAVNPFRIYKLLHHWKHRNRLFAGFPL